MDSLTDVDLDADVGAVDSGQELGDTTFLDLLVDGVGETFPDLPIDSAGESTVDQATDPVGDVQIPIDQVQCLPCNSDEECAVGSGNLRCVVYGDSGRYCGFACRLDTDCGQGFACQDATSIAGQAGLFCMAETGECSCSELAIRLHSSTSCVVRNGLGTCSGIRACASGGLTACAAAAPEADICNGLDDDCDGDTDDMACDDSNPCTQDICEGADGCQFVPLLEGACDDQDPCTESDACQLGWCVGSLKNCDDENICTTDSCIRGTGNCENAPNDLWCNDSDPCTGNDRCDGGECSGVALDCSCDTNEDCAFLNTPDVCDGSLYCDQVRLPYRCAVVPGSIVTCPLPQPGPDALCQVASCDPVSGGCSVIPAAEGLECNDLNECTVGDRCEAGVCVGEYTANCNDGNPCTEDSCDPDGACLHVANDKPCDDLNACTIGDVCSEGRCTFAGALDCDDHNVCTSDLCNPSSGCENVDNTIHCDDGNACTEGEVCSAGKCVTTPVSCDDGILCTDDSCDEALGCIHDDNSALCDDGNSCTIGDRCQDGTCQGNGTMDCDDDDMCTRDICLVDGGCDHIAISGVVCSDGNACTIFDACVAGRCISDIFVDCDDNNICTTDSCDVLGGCQHKNNELECDDGNACTTGDTCRGGRCVLTGVLHCDDGNICTTDSCDPVLGCDNLNNTNPCDDGNACSINDRCIDGFCIEVERRNCNDGMACTVDTCDDDLGCLNLPSAARCDDGVACTQDSCDPLEGCLHVPLATACDDEIPCTLDSCDPVQGCHHVTRDAECDDNVECTVDSCSATAGCVNARQNAVCNDSNPCTTDACLVGGCSNEDVANGTNCGTKMECQSGQCVTQVLSYLVSSGPIWISNPTSYSCQEACALLFGGSRWAWNCSTSSTTVTHTGWMSRFAQGCFEMAEDFKTCTPYWGCYSAYVNDHCSNQRNYCIPAVN